MQRQAPLDKFQVEPFGFWVLGFGLKVVLANPTAEPIIIQHIRFTSMDSCGSVYFVVHFDS